jgi:hypothetical protein
MTTEQVKALSYHTEVHAGECKHCIGSRGGTKTKSEVWRVSGRVQLWKRNPERFSVPIKHGLYSNAHITPDNVHLFHLASECNPTVLHVSAV